MERIVGAAGTFEKRLKVPGDKSLSHRGLIFAAMASGKSRLTGLSDGGDVLSTARCLRKLKAKIAHQKDGSVTVVGWGPGGWTEPDSLLDCGNSGTALRLLAGVVAAHPGLCLLSGDRSLRSRPMGRIVKPLRAMGATVHGRDHDRLPPLAIKGGTLKDYSYELPVASAQVKSCLLLAGLAAGVEVSLTEPGQSRNHTELMMQSLGLPIEHEVGRARLKGGGSFDGFEFAVPGDPSSAAFLVAAAVISPGSSVVVENVNLNPGRIAFFEILKEMGADIQWRQTSEELGESVGEIEAHGSELTAVEVGPDRVPQSIDELPLLAVVATQARGKTRVWGAEELRHKESDRIRATVTELSKMGARITEHDDGFTIYGPCELEGAAVTCHHDHRLEMGLAVAGLVARGRTRLRGCGWAEISFPTFWELYPGLVE